MAVSRGRWPVLSIAEADARLTNGKILKGELKAAFSAAPLEA